MSADWYPGSRREEAYAKLPADAKWSCSFGYPGERGFTEYFRDASGKRWVITNGAYGDDWKCTEGGQ